MSGVSITGLDPASTLTGSEIVPIVQSGTTVRTTLAAMPYVPAGTGAVTTTIQSKLRETVSVKDFGAVGDGVTNDCDAFRAAIAASTHIYIPQGTYLIEPTATSGDFLLYLGTQGVNGNPSSRNGMHIYGDGNTSVIKLGNNVGAAKLLFGGANGDSFANMTFENFAINLNGANNLQPSFGSPTRYNSAFYFYCPCVNITFNKLYIYDGSGSQWIRIGNDTANGYGTNIKVLDCRFNNFGIGITGNYQQDVSVCYIQADGILIDGNWFQNSDFTFDLAIGHTALELHGSKSTIITNNRFTYTQVPVLLASSLKDNENTIIDANVFQECNLLASFDPSSYDQRRAIISNNNYFSTKVLSSSIIKIGDSAENSKVRENFLIEGNVINGSGNTNERTHLIYIESAYLRDLTIQNNDISKLNGYLLYLAGEVRNSNQLNITIQGNRLDSLGPTSGTFPNTPAFLYAATTSGTTKTLAINNNVLLNSDNKDYSINGCFYLSSNISYAFVEGNSQSFNVAYPMVTDAIANNVFKAIQSSFYIPVNYRSNVVTVPASSSVNLYQFTSGNGWGNNDNAMLQIQLWIGIGGTTDNTVQFLNVGWLSSGGSVTTVSNFGAFSSQVTVSFSGTTLQVSSTYGSPLSMYYVVQGYSTKPITWLV